MENSNDALGEGWVTLKVKIKNRISAEQYNDDYWFEEWVLSSIQDFNYNDAEIIKNEIGLSDFDYNPEY